MSGEPEPSVDREIAEQPAVLERLLARPGWDELASRVAARAPEGLLTVARGSSDNAASFLSYLVWLHLERPAGSVPPSIATVHGKTPRASGRLALGISQSGESPDVVRALEALRAGGAFTLAMTNAPGSALARAADETIDLACGPERAVAATKTFTASLAAGLALALRWAGRRDLVRALERLPDAVARAIRDVPSPFFVNTFALPLEPKPRNVLVLGRGLTLPLAQELALKLKEMARVPAEALSTHEFVHGPLGALEPETPVLVLLPNGPEREGCQAIGGLLAERGAWVTFQQMEADLPEELAAIPRAVKLQQLAVAIARARGIDPDRPRHIQKVTRTW